MKNSGQLSRMLVGTAVSVVSLGFACTALPTTALATEPMAVTVTASVDVRSAPVATALAATSATVTATSDVNLRSGPGTSYAVVGVLARGASLPATGVISGG